jgi:hypothetical protein
MKIFNDFRFFLGEQRFRSLMLLLLVTGLASTFFMFLNRDWSVNAQTLTFFVFLFGATFIIIGAMDGDQRYRWGAVLIPAIIALLIGAVIVPQFFGFAVGAAFGWLVAGTLIFGRSREPMQYKLAVKALRKGAYDEAVKHMDAIIKEEPETAHHYGFRAELLRFAGKLPRAKSDYERMKNLAKDDIERTVAYNGMAEIDLQAKSYTAALASAEKAYELAPKDWVTAYNLGMIQDRLKDSSAVLDSLKTKLTAKVPDYRHRLLIQFYILRAYSRLSQFEDAKNALKELKVNTSGLQEWEHLLAQNNAKILRDILADDVKTIKELVQGNSTIESVK